jgi:hypothetical protein
METKRKTGAWWRRELLGLYTLPLERTPDGKIVPAQQQLTTDDSDETDHR